MIPGFDMTDTLFRKNVILRRFDLHSPKTPLSPGLEVKHRLETNGENYVSLMGTKAQINTYLQDAPLISERLRTLNDLPKMRIINSVKVNIQ
jgi:hypothetical protein